MAVSEPGSPADWPVVPLVDLAEVNPESLSAGTAAEFRFQYIDLSSVQRGEIDWSLVQELTFATAPSRARRLVRPGDVLFGTVRPALQSHGAVPALWADGTIVASTGFSVIRARRSTADERFLFHFVLSDAVTSEVRRVEVGSNYPAVNEADVRRFLLPKPPLPEQHRIAEILDMIDEAISHTKLLIAKLKQVKEGLLHDLLTLGIDDNGELRDPQLHPKQFEASPQGPIPRGWTVERLGSVAAKIQDGTHFSPQSSDGPYRYVTSKNVRFGFLDLSDCGWISESEHQTIFARCDVRAGDVLLTKDGANTGNAALNTVTEEFSLLSSVAFVRLNPKRDSPTFLLQYLLSPLGQRRIKDAMSGLAITRLTLRTIKQFLVPRPSHDEQLRIAAPLAAIDDRLQQELLNMRKLQGVRDGIAHDLLSGRVRVTGVGKGDDE